MRCFRLVGLCLVVVFAMGAVGVSVASAVVPEPFFAVGNTGAKEGAKTLLVGETREGTATFGEGELYAIGDENIDIKCKSGTGKGTIENQEAENTKTKVKSLLGALANASVTFEGCEVVGAPTCTINGEAAGKGKITAEKIAGMLGYAPGKANAENVRLDLSGTKEETIKGKAEKEVLTVIKLGTCVALEGPYVVKKSVIGAIPTADINTLLTSFALPFKVNAKHEQELTEIEYQCFESGVVKDSLTYGGNAAAFEGEGTFKFTPKVSGEEVDILT